MLELGITEIAKIPSEHFAFVCGKIDRLDKEPWAKIEEELNEVGFEQS